MKKRSARLKRTTSETDISVELCLDGSGTYKVSTGIPFMDHMLELFAKHGAFRILAKESSRHK